MLEEKIKMNDGFNISCTIFDLKNPKGIVQIIHGAKEHRKRYYDFAKFLNDNGYVVVVSDNRGHGESVDESYPLGYMPNYKLIVDDQIQITKFIKVKYPKIPIYVIGHSLGSMFARMYIAKNDNMVEKLVLSGTANYIPEGIIGIFIGNILKVFKGSHGYSKLLERFANFLDDSWVVGDKKALEKYRQDKYCTYKYPIATMVEIFKINRDMHKITNYQIKNQKLQIFSVNGALDPVTGFKKGLNDSERFLKKVGYIDVSFQVYEGMYHEVLNETDKQLVYNDILKFLNK